MSLVRAIRSFSRLRQIVNILFKEGIEEIIDELRFRSHLPFEKQIQRKKKKTSRTPPEVRLRRAMDSAGGAFVKLGQMLSLRPDLIPQEYCDEFAKLQDHVSPFPYSQVKKTIEKELGKPLNKIFREFEKEPIASASVGQVHKAQLKSGHWVAVKVQRPNIRKSFNADIDILSYLVEKVEANIPEIRKFKPRKILTEFEEYTKEELDFTQEAGNIDVFFKRYKYHPHIKVPRVFWDFCSPKVITMSFIKGEKVSEAKNLTKKDKKKITLVVYRSFIDQIFDMHIFHADPHPGNVFIMENKKIALLDFGIVGRISPDFAASVELLLIGLVKGDLDILTESFMEIGVVPGDIDERSFKEDIFNAWGKYHGKDTSQINMKSFFMDSFEIARKYDIEYPGNFVLLTKAVITTEALGRKFYPEGNFVKICTPQVENLIKKQKSPENIFRSVKKDVIQFGSTIKKFPQDLRTLMRILRKGTNIRVDIDNQDIKSFTRELDNSSNRVALGILIGSCIIGAGLIILAGIGPLIFGIPLFAWFILFIALMLSGALTISILREEKGGD